MIALACVIHVASCVSSAVPVMPNSPLTASRVVKSIDEAGVLTVKKLFIAPPQEKSDPGHEGRGRRPMNGQVLRTDANPADILGGGASNRSRIAGSRGLPYLKRDVTGRAARLRRDHIGNNIGSQRRVFGEIRRARDHGGKARGLVERAGNGIDAARNLQNDTVLLEDAAGLDFERAADAPISAAFLHIVQRRILRRRRAAERANDKRSKSDPEVFHFSCSIARRAGGNSPAVSGGRFTALSDGS